MADNNLFAPLPRKVLSDIEACRYLRLDVGREDNTASQIRALNTLVDRRKAIMPTMYRHKRLYEVAELDRFIESQRRND